MFLKHICRVHFDNFSPVTGSSLHHKNFNGVEEYGYSFTAESQAIGNKSNAKQ